MYIHMNSGNRILLNQKLGQSEEGNSGVDGLEDRMDTIERDIEQACDDAFLDCHIVGIKEKTESVWSSGTSNDRKSVGGEKYFEVNVELIPRDLHGTIPPESIAKAVENIKGLEGVKNVKSDGEFVDIILRSDENRETVESQPESQLEDESNPKETMVDPISRAMPY